MSKDLLKEFIERRVMELENDAEELIQEKDDPDYADKKLYAAQELRIILEYLKINPKI